MVSGTVGLLLLYCLTEIRSKEINDIFITSLTVSSFRLTSWIMLRWQDEVAGAGTGPDMVKIAGIGRVGRGKGKAEESLPCESAETGSSAHRQH